MLASSVVPLEAVRDPAHLCAALPDVRIPVPVYGELQKPQRPLLVAAFAQAVLPLVAACKHTSRRLLVHRQGPYVTARALPRATLSVPLQAEPSVPALVVTCCPLENSRWQFVAEDSSTP